MKKLNETRSMNLRVVSDDQLDQVVGGSGGHHSSHGGHLSNGGQQGATSRHDNGHGHRQGGGAHVTINNFFITSDNIGGSGNTNIVRIVSRNS